MGPARSVPPWLNCPLLLQDSAGEPLYKLFKAIKHQVEKGPVDAVQKKAKYTLNDTGLLGDDVEYAPLVSPGAEAGAGMGLRDSSRCCQVLGQPQSQKLGAVRGLTWAQLGSGRACESPAGVSRERLCVSWAPGSAAGVCGAWASRCAWW